MSEQPPTVADMLNDPARIARRLESLMSQAFIADALLGTQPPLTRRAKLRNRAWLLRERLADWIMP